MHNILGRWRYRLVRIFKECRQPYNSLCTSEVADLMSWHVEKETTGGARLYVNKQTSPTTQLWY